MVPYWTGAMSLSCPSAVPTDNRSASKQSTEPTLPQDTERRREPCIPPPTSIRSRGFEKLNYTPACRKLAIRFIHPWGPLVNIQTLDGIVTLVACMSG